MTSEKITGITLAADIDIFNKEQIALIREELHHSSIHDHEAFSAQAYELFKAAGVPVLLQGEKGDNNVKSFINGADLYSINETTHNEYRDQLGAVKDAQELLSKMPLQARHDLMDEMNKIAEKYQPLLDLAIALEVGKPGTEFSKAREWLKYGSSNAEFKNYLKEEYVFQDGQGNRFFMDPAPKGAKEFTFHDKDGKPFDISKSTDITIFHTPEVQGSGITLSTNGFNYPAALFIPDLVESLAVGNGLIAKTVAKAPSTLFIFKTMLNEALDNMSQKAGSYEWAEQAKNNGVDLANADTLGRLKNIFQIISGQKMFTQALHETDTVRFVGGLAGKNIEEARKGVDPDHQRTITELGGNNAIVVLNSAANIEGKSLKDIAKELAVTLATNSNQRCTGPRRLFVEEGIRNEFMALLTEEMNTLISNKNGTVGNPLLPVDDKNIKSGAMDKRGYEEAQHYIAHAKSVGAEVIGGHRLFEDVHPNAYYMAPAMLLCDNITEKHQEFIHHKEIFAPVLSVLTVKNIDHAIELANKADERLTGAIYSSDSNEVDHYSKNVLLGSLQHNTPPKDQSPVGVHRGHHNGGKGSTGSLEAVKHYIKDRLKIDDSPQSSVIQIGNPTKLVEFLGRAA